MEEIPTPQELEHSGRYVSMWRLGERAQGYVRAARNHAKVTEGMHAELMALSVADYRSVLCGRKSVRPELVDLLATTLGYRDWTALVQAMDAASPKVSPIRPVP